MISERGMRSEEETAEMGAEATAEDLAEVTLRAVGDSRWGSVKHLAREARKRADLTIQIRFISVL